MAEHGKIHVSKNDTEIEVTDMGDALMNWEAGRCRWRKKYRGKWLQISPAALGGTTATDTKLAANQWYREQQAQRDQELAQEVPRSNEWWECRRELEMVQSAINTLSAVMKSDPSLQPKLTPKIELLQQKETLLAQALRQTKVPPLNIKLRNPLNVSPEQIENEAVWEVEQQITDRLAGQSQSPYDVLLLRSLPFDGTQSTESYTTQIPHDAPTAFIATNGDNDMSVYEERVHAVAKTVASLKDSVVARKKKELGLIESEYERGTINQILKEAGAAVPESRKLNHHIEKFFEAKKQECKLGNIQAGRLKKIISTIDSYRKWSPIINGNVDRIGTKEHIESYYSFLVQQVLAEEIKPKYARDLFGDFKMLVYWLVNEEVLKENPRCLQLKSNKYVFPKTTQKPKIIPLPLVRQVLEAANANPRLKLCILLTLNCGFGASEIGKLTKDEYNPSTGRITHKRYKTEKFDNVPTVCYKLWAETKELLDQEIANRKKYPQHPASAELLLVNSNGMPLWNDSMVRFSIQNHHRRGRSIEK